MEMLTLKKRKQRLLRKLILSNSLSNNFKKFIKRKLQKILIYEEK